MPRNAVIGAPSSQQQPWSFTRLKEQMIPRMGCQQVPWIDIVIFGHEIDMLQYVVLDCMTQYFQLQLWLNQI